ncbi:MAG: hypothetical protein KF758_15815 [Anaerolineales bacterium]|nr:hypothetical protein [Anaerolineales bacterium]MBX3038380.1 hypothetical protein [Anaerolineales bacterium]
MKIQPSQSFNKNLFEKTVKENFYFLQDKYGFLAPVVTDYGREIYVKYERGNQTVSISYEFGSNPLIEIFYPSNETGDKSIPWASKNDVKRSRRFSKVKTSILFSDDEDVIKNYVKEISLEFETIEKTWLQTTTEK